MRQLALMIVFLLNGCLGTPKEPKKPDSFPRVPINKTIPSEVT